MKLVSVNIGTEEAITHDGKTYSTGICKRPVDGDIALDAAGLAGDTILDTVHHGGPDQAVYGYSLEDYEWWAEHRAGEYPPGVFGENLTIAGLPTDMNIGDRLLIGEVVLEATSPRIPCRTFAARMQDTGFGLEFRAAERPGVYFRVLNGGSVSTGDAVTYVVNESSDVSVVELFRFNYALHSDPADLQRFLDAPLATRMRKKVEARLSATEKRTNIA